MKSSALSSNLIFKLYLNIIHKYIYIYIYIYPSPNFLFIKSLLPTANNNPLDIIPILSAKISASSKWWVVNMIVLFSYFMRSSIFQIDLLEFASIPEVGSSKKIIYASPIKLSDKDNFLIEPPESSPTNFYFS
jgi:hypothetical protein